MFFFGTSTKKQQINIKFTVANSKHKNSLLLTMACVIVSIVGVSFWMCYRAVQKEAYARYVGIKNVSAGQVAKTIRGVEMNAKNIFDEVNKNLDTPDAVIAALESKVNLNRDVHGYFAAFELNYFPEKGTWFEPYINQSDGIGFSLQQVGSARHNYTKSDWYVRAKKTGESFWSDPYYYYDGTSMSGHYCTFVQPLYNANGDLACVCGADMKFEWMAKELQWVDDVSKESDLLNKHHLIADFDFYTVILENSGTCLAHPEGKSLSVTDKDVLRDLSSKRSGVVDMEVDGEPCRVYYGPIEFIDWAAAVVVPRHDILMPLLPTTIVLLLLAILGFVAVWLICRKL